MKYFMPFLISIMVVAICSIINIDEFLVGWFGACGYWVTAIIYKIREDDE